MYDIKFFHTIVFYCKEFSLILKKEVEKYSQVNTELYLSEYFSYFFQFLNFVPVILDQLNKFYFDLYNLCKHELRFLTNTIDVTGTCTNFITINGLYFDKKVEFRTFVEKINF